MRRPAFTLLEVMAVVALMGLLACGAVWLLASDAQQASQADVIRRITAADRMARMAAQHSGKTCVLRIDLEQQRLCRVEGDGEAGHASAKAVQLPAGYRIDRIVVASLDPEGPAGRRVESGAVDIAYSTRGRSVTYAVRLLCTNAAASEGSQGDWGRGGKWLVLAGLTGQPVVVDDEDEVDKLFCTLACGRPDPH